MTGARGTPQISIDDSRFWVVQRCASCLVRPGCPRYIRLSSNIPGHVLTLTTVVTGTNRPKLDGGHGNKMSQAEHPGYTEPLNAPAINRAPASIVAWLRDGSCVSLARIRNNTR